MGMFLCDTSTIAGFGWGNLSLDTFLPFKHVDVSVACAASAPATNSTLLGALEHPFWLVSIAENWFLDVLALATWLAILVVALTIILLHRRSYRKTIDMRS